MTPRPDHKSYYSQFAHASYGSWKDEFNPPDNYVLVSKYSDDESQIYKNDTNIVMAIRGTKNLKKDLITDAFLMVDALRATKRYKSEFKKCTTIIKELKKPVILCAHSMGAAIAIALNRDLEDGIQECHAYNPGTSLMNLPTEVLEKIVCKFFLKKKCKSRERLYIHRQMWDPVSIASNIISENTTTDNDGIHTISSFLPKNGGSVESEPEPELIDYSKMKKNQLYNILLDKGEKVTKSMTKKSLLEKLT